MLHLVTWNIPSDTVEKTRQRFLTSTEETFDRNTDPANHGDGR